MADQILSQEELDALFAAIGSGAVNVETVTARPKTEARPYDLTAQSPMPHDRHKVPLHEFRARLNMVLHETPVNMAVELGQTIYTIGQILRLEKNQIVKLNTGPQDPVIVKIEGVPKYLGKPCMVKGNRAVQITARIAKDKGE